MASATKRVSHPIFARAFDHTVWKLEDRGQREHRNKMLECLVGRVIDVGGTTASTPDYPDSVMERRGLTPRTALPTLSAVTRHFARSSADA